MARLLVLLILLGLVFWGLHWLRTTPTPQVARVLRRVLLWGGLALLILAVLSGRLNPLFAAFAAAVPLILRLLNLLRLAPLIHSFLQALGIRGGMDRPPHSEPGGALSHEEARAILGLEPNASPEQIRAAHRRLIQQFHPDRGGSDYLAARINQAKKTLLDG
jgi:hypothetical protein